MSWPPLPWTCTDCGSPIEDRLDRHRCGACQREFYEWLRGCETPHPELAARLARYERRAKHEEDLFA